MRKLISLTALAVALALPTAASADQNGNGNGKGGGKDKNQSERSDDRGRGNDDRRDSGGQARGNDDRAERGRGRGDRDDRPVVVVRDGGRDMRDGNRRDDGRRMVDLDDGRAVIVRRGDDRRTVIVGCPPGLAKKDNGCLPPGQARKIERDRYDYLWSSRGDDNYRYRYDDGYLYRTDQRGSLLGYLPVLGGALSLGNMWPSQYNYQPVSQYQSSYFGLNDQRNYRYADGALYGLDPRTQAISSVAALLTGQQFNVGQQMPAGYDIYNVPYDYRNQYADSAQAQYRYNDGYVYQVDPTTQLVKAVIQLLT